MQAYQIATATPTSLPQGVVMATTGSSITSPQQLTEEAQRKRELRLLKNRYLFTFIVRLIFAFNEGKKEET